jgi:hypothetical protein
MKENSARSLTDDSKGDGSILVKGCIPIISTLANYTSSRTRKRDAEDLYRPNAYNGTINLLISKTNSVWARSHLHVMVDGNAKSSFMNSRKERSSPRE